MRRGFTLLEVLVAMSILIVIVAVVYASFASVTDTISVARVRTEEMRLRQFLERSLRTNLTSVYVDRGFEQQVFQFVGTNDENSDGPRDSLRFVSTNALMGGRALPGDFKEVRYEIYGGEMGRLGLGVDKEKQRQFEATDATPDQAKLEATETPLLASNAQAVDAETGNLDLTQNNTRHQNTATYEAPSWSVPVRTVDFTYYDGTQWVDEWDSQVQGRLPWCVRARINFARTDEEIQAEKNQRIDIVENPDFEVVVPLPLSLGLITDGRTQSQLEDRQANAQEEAEIGGGGGGRGGRGGRNNRGEDGEEADGRGDRPRNGRGGAGGMLGGRGGRPQLPPGNSIFGRGSTAPRNPGTQSGFGSQSGIGAQRDIGVGRGNTGMMTQ